MTPRAAYPISPFTGPPTVAWQPTIKVKNRTEEYCNDAHIRWRPTEIPKLLSHSNAELVQLPSQLHLRIRATYLDSIASFGMVSYHDRSWTDASSFGKLAFQNLMTVPLSMLRKEYSWILPFFCQTESQLKINSTTYPDNALTHGFVSPSNNQLQWIPYYNCKDLERFLADAKKFGNGKRLFLTTYSVGFTHTDWQQGDVVFAVDGAPWPIILRETKRGYAFAGICYLWAATDKDHWSRGCELSQQRWAGGYSRHLPEERLPEHRQWTGMIKMI